MPAVDNFAAASATGRRHSAARHKQQGDAVADIQSGDLIAALDEASLSGFHLRAVVASGVGFFTDAYDLLVIGIASALITKDWHLGSGQLAVLNSTMLAAVQSRSGEAGPEVLSTVSLPTICASSCLGHGGRGAHIRRYTGDRRSDHYPSAV
jgi:hypothetical protein